MKKLFSTVLLAASIMFLMTTQSSAVSEDHLKVFMRDFYIETEYTTDEAYVSVNRSNGVSSYNIISRKDNSILETFLESDDTPLLTKMHLSDPENLTNYIQKVFNHNIYWTYGGKTLTFRSTVITNFYYSGSFRQINGIGASDFNIISSGSWDMEEKKSAVYPVYPKPGEYPATKVSVTVTGVPKIVYGNALSAGYSFNFLNFFGFNVSSTTSKTTTVRSTIEKQYYINLYKY